MAVAKKRKNEEAIEAAELQIVEQSKKIDFYITEYSVELLANKMRDGAFVVPDYQRAFTWEKDRKSRFIESLIMGLPIPFLFFWEMGNGNLEIVDGSQRLRTIEEFILGEFELGKLSSLSHLSKFKFSDLPDSRRRKIGNRSIRGIVLNEHADEQARFDMFDRINTSSKVANKAEVRRGAAHGTFLDLVIELSVEPSFISLAPVSKKLRLEREHEELVTRFFAYGDGLEGYRDRPADFLFDYVKRMNGLFEEDPELVETYRKRFLDTVRFVNQVFPHGFRKTATANATPRARFEAIAIGSYLAIKENPNLDHKDNFSVETWLTKQPFVEVTGSDGANSIARLKDRLYFVKNKLLGAE